MLERGLQTMQQPATTVVMGKLTELECVVVFVVVVVALETAVVVADYGLIVTDLNVVVVGKPKLVKFECVADVVNVVVVVAD